jgi:glycosyltransferase involved in cell wall biosynthesis
MELMRYLFIHQNFPGQFRHVVKALADIPGNEIVALGDVKNLNGLAAVNSAVRIVAYSLDKNKAHDTHHYIRDFEGHIRRGQSVVKALLKIRDGDKFYPDVIVVHPGWGEGLFLKDVYPRARLVAYAEFYYRGLGSDVGFDPEFPATLDDQLRVRIKNSTQLNSLIQADAVVSPTEWQKSGYPAELQQKIHLIHEGIDTELVKPEASAWIKVNEKKFQAGDEIVTYVARNLEPYRGFHTFIRSIPTLQALRPNAQIVIVGGNDVSYGKRPPAGQSYSERYCEEVKDQVDWRKVFFVGPLSYANYLRVLQVSAAHVYLTYPFVLSWSMLEAMSVGGVLVASDSAPVREVIEDGRNGHLVDFFDSDQVAHKLAHVLAFPEEQQLIRKQARETVVSRFDLREKALPAILQLLRA